MRRRLGVLAFLPLTAIAVSDCVLSEAEYIGGPRNSELRETEEGGTDCLPAAQEDCTNCRDDNCDGLSDDQDPQCADQRPLCATTPPSDWLGPVLLQEAAPDRLRDCEEGYGPIPVYQGFAELSVPSQCPCACAPSGVKCTATLEPCGGKGYCSWTSKECAECNVPPGSLESFGIRVATSVTSGACVVSSPSSALPPSTSWGIAARACAPASSAPDSCGVGKTCLPRPALSLRTPLCIFHKGDVECSSSAEYNTKHTYYEAVRDDRTCSQCECDPPPSSGCSGQMSITTTGCAGLSLQTFPIPSQCSAWFVPPESLHLDSLAFDPKACKPAKGAGLMTGSAEPEPASATTFCCTF